MALRMRARMAELQKYWQKLGVSSGLQVRIGITSGFCTVGNFGSEQRLDYSVLGSPVNLAARLQNMAEPETILIDGNTHSLIKEHVSCQPGDEITPKGFARAVQTFLVDDFLSEDHRQKRRRLSHVGEHVEVNVIDSSDIHAVIAELHQIQKDFEAQLREG